MGLEGLELMLAVEDEFGIWVPEERAQEMETVRDLYDYIVETLISIRTGVCPSMFVFYRMRRSLADSLGIDRRSITPDTEFTALLRGENARWEHWQQMRDRIGLKIADLRVPRMHRRVVRRGSILAKVLVVALMVSGALLSSLISWWLAPMGLFVGAVAGGWLMLQLWSWQHSYERSHSTLIPEGHETPRAIISRIVPENEWLIQGESREWLRGNIEERLLHHVREVCCYIPRDITLDSRFVDDLKFG